MVFPVQRPLFHLRAVRQHADAFNALGRLLHPDLAADLAAVDRCGIGHARGGGELLLGACAEHQGHQRDSWEFKCSFHEPTLYRSRMDGLLCKYQIDVMSRVYLCIECDLVSIQTDPSL